MSEAEAQAFLAQFDKAREDFKNWPQWMQDAAVERVASFPRGVKGTGEARPFTGALNDIPATLTHDEGAYAQCGECGRYTLNPNALTDRPPPCDCGSKHGWSGSFKRPGPDAKWSGLIQPTPGVGEVGRG